MSSCQTDRDFRPASYFRPQPLEEWLLSRVKGAVLRRKLKSLFAQGLHDEAKQLVAEMAGARDATRFLESVHPMFMGGNYLPDVEHGEVEIARIAIQSTTHDVTCVYAQMINGLIHYRVVDEYGGDTLDQNMESTKTSRQPLTLGELVDFFLSAWPLVDVLEMNFENDLEGALSFFSASSDFYPEFSAACTEQIIERYPDPAESSDHDGPETGS